MKKAAAAHSPPRRGGRSVPVWPAFTGCLYGVMNFE